MTTPTAVAAAPSSDSCQSQGHISVAVPNISTLQRTFLSDPIFIRELPWLEEGERVREGGERGGKEERGGREGGEMFICYNRRIMVMPKNNKNQDGSEGESKSLGVFVQCDPDNTDTP